MKTLQDIITKGKRIVFFGGAGVSTESGIPDFRSSTGIYKTSKLPDGLTAEMVLSHSFFFTNPAFFYEFYRERMLFPNAKPNAAHKKLYELEQCGKLRGIVTQNIDGLHRISGNKLVYEVHGTVYDNYCIDCEKHYDLDWMMHTTGIPHCDECGGVVKPNVVLYGESLDTYTCRGACREISECDVLIVGGTSLTVEPVASFLSYFSGKELVIINRDSTPRDDMATLIIRESIAEVMGNIKV